uniref:FAM186A/B C-terminal domain-containing protein n=1 Tax=Terrapene triunguis TaxID=2587831 RepID=A0A674JV58_9SAUR
MLRNIRAEILCTDLTEKPGLKITDGSKPEPFIPPPTVNFGKKVVMNSSHSPWVWISNTPKVESLGYRVVVLLWRRNISHNLIPFLSIPRQTLMSRLEAARAVNNGAEVRNLYTYVERVDAYRKKVLQCWVAKQKTAEQTRRHCLGKMISLFAQLRLSSELHLNSPSPLVIKAVDEMKEFPSSAHARSKSPGYPSPLASVKKQVCDQIESVWRTDVISHSFPIVPKPHVSLLWSQAGFPDIPRFLELDVSSVRSKPLKSLQTR